MRGAKNNKKSKVATGRIIAVFFILILAGLIYFIANLFWPRSVNAQHMEGLWKLAGSPVKYYRFSEIDSERQSGVCTYYEKSAGSNDQFNRKSYTWSMVAEDKDNAGKKQTRYVLTFVNEDDKTDTMVWKVTNISRATIDIVNEDNKTVQLTTTSIF